MVSWGQEPRWQDGRMVGADESTELRRHPKYRLPTIQYFEINQRRVLLRT